MAPRTRRGRPPAGNPISDRATAWAYAGRRWPDHVALLAPVHASDGTRSPSARDGAELLAAARTLQRAVPALGAFPGIAAEVDRFVRMLEVATSGEARAAVRVTVGDRVTMAVQVFIACERWCSPPLPLPTARDLMVIAVCRQVDAPCAAPELVERRLAGWKKYRGRALALYRSAR